MYQIAIVVFRESLEIAFLLGVILAITKPIKNSKIYVIFGTLFGFVLASTFAIFARYIINSFDDLGDEIFNASIILITSLMIIWTIVWMQGYTKKIKNNLGKLSEEIKAGRASKIMIILVVAMAIFREGSEIILFIYSIASTNQIEASDYIIGLSIGCFLGFLTGTALYLGLVKYARKYVFNISAILLTLIAAGLASDAAGILTSSGIIESLSDELWDSSWIINDQSITGKMLHIIIGYDSRPNLMQAMFYLGTIAITILMIKLKSKRSEQ